MAEQWHEVRVFLEPGLYEALRVKSIESGRTVTELVNDAVRAAVEKDAEGGGPRDAGIAEEQSYEDVLRGLESGGQR